MKLKGKDILKQPQPHFETFKALFTHGVLGLSHSGRPIWVMKVHLAALRTSQGRRSHVAGGAYLSGETCFPKPKILAGIC